MPRRARVVAVGYPHHVTQRGNSRQQVFFEPDDRVVYLDLVQEYARHYQLRIISYCLMTNHVHWVVVPEEDDSLAKALGKAHYRYAQHVNKRRQRTGHLWQNRFYSCPLEGGHLITGLRYVEQNPVRAGLAEIPWHWPWSSAAAHVGAADWPEWLDRQDWPGELEPTCWQQVLVTEGGLEAESVLRASTIQGCPVGGLGFVEALEKRAGRSLRLMPPHRPAKNGDCPAFGNGDCPT